MNGLIARRVPDKAKQIEVSMGKELKSIDGWSGSGIKQGQKADKRQKIREIMPDFYIEPPSSPLSMASVIVLFLCGSPG